jgi:hypothetical protein
MYRCSFRFCKFNADSEHQLKGTVGLEQLITSSQDTGVVIKHQPGDGQSSSHCTMDCTSEHVLSVIE